MHVLVADLHEDRTALRQQVARDRQTVAQIGQVGVDAVLPGVAERLDCSGSRLMSVCLPSLTSRDSVETCQFELNLMP